MKKSEKTKEKSSEVGGDLYPENNSIEKGLKHLPCIVPTDSCQRCETETRDEEAFRQTLKRILSTIIAPETVAQAVKSTPLGEKITYQEAILIAQVLKASNGDTQAASFIRDTSGNKLKDANGESCVDIRTFETL